MNTTKPFRISLGTSFQKFTLSFDMKFTWDHDELLILENIKLIPKWSDPKWPPNCSWKS